ncbi:MAG: ABC transporter permease [Chloroflexota bacterium]|jgi:ABC-type polysaccharide/polyol phosphate export permease
MEQSIPANSTVEVYDSAQRLPPALVEFKEAWRYRDLIRFLVRRDVTARYKRSVLGIAWTMLNPLGMMIILSIVFSEVFRVTIEGYPAYVLSALIAWTFFSQTSSSAINALVWGGDLLQRIYIPRSTFAISAIGTGLVNLLLSMVPLLAVTLAIGIPLHATLLLSPLAMILLAMFSLGVGLLISTIGIYFADVVEMYQIILTAWFYVTPIIYPLDILPQNVEAALQFNPTVHLIGLFRDLVFYGIIPPAQNWLVCLAISAGTLLVGWLVFTGKSDEFAYRT